MNTEDNFWNDALVKEFVKAVLEEGSRTDVKLEYLQTIFKMAKNESPKQPYKGVGFEILSYLNPNCVSDIKDGCVVKAPDSYAEIRNYPIHSVRRIEDNEVLTIGDNTTNGVIVSFDLREGDMYVGFKREKNHCSIESAVKVKEPKLLYVSFDDKPIYEGDTFCAIQKNTWGLLTDCRYKLNQHLEWIIFSTEDAAKEYIDRFQKRFSKDNVKKLFNINVNDTRWQEEVE